VHEFSLTSNPIEEEMLLGIFLMTVVRNSLQLQRLHPLGFFSYDPNLSVPPFSNPREKWNLGNSS